MLDVLVAPPEPNTLPARPDLFAALEQAAGAIARLDQALENHPLCPAFLYRTRLEAVRRQAAVDGQGIDPWHLAATIEGLRLRVDSSLRLVDRGAIFAAARTALTLHQWIVAPDFDQEGAVREAERHLAAATVPSALLGAAVQTHAWLHGDGGRSGGEPYASGDRPQAETSRPAMRAALIRFWVRRRLLRIPVPLTGPGALAADAPADPAAWACTFLTALARETRDYHQLLQDMERAWLAARARVVGRRSTSRAAMAVDVLAAAPLLSATTLARAIGMSVKCATELLDRFLAEAIVVEVTHRSARRLFGLVGLAPLRDQVAPPRRPEPGRGRGRPPHVVEEEAAPAPDLLPVLPLSPAERQAIDYSDLDQWMAHAEQVIRDTRRRLGAIAAAGVGERARIPETDRGAPTVRGVEPSDSLRIEPPRPNDGRRDTGRPS